ncbi:MAG: hypothetical protein GX850_00535 [Clostridiaceae bacterium]|nr:hypothetical protein [Clostridiaceae bacterium]
MKKSEMAGRVQSPLSLCSIACSETLRELLRRSVIGDPAPVLLVGEEGAGKHFVAQRLAAAILCDQPDPISGACGECASCRLLRSGSHYDLIDLEPPKGKKMIAVASVREQISGTLHTYPQVSRKRVYIISAVKADTLNEQGQNAILKPLEEHPDFIRFILLTEDANRLLPTILSRSRMVQLGRREEQDIRLILREMEFGEGETADLAVRYADGIPGQALAIAGDATFRDLRRQAFKLFICLPESTRTFCLTQGLSYLRDEKNRIATILRLFETFLRDLLLLKSGLSGTNLINGDLVSDLDAILKRVPNTDPARAAEIVQQTGQALARNVNFDHSIGRMLIGMRAFLSAETVPQGVFLCLEDQAF